MQSARLRSLITAPDVGSEFPQLIEHWCTNAKINATREFRLMQGDTELFGFHDHPDDDGQRFPSCHSLSGSPRSVLFAFESAQCSPQRHSAAGTHSRSGFAAGGCLTSTVVMASLTIGIEWPNHALEPTLRGRRDWWCEHASVLARKAWLSLRSLGL